MNNLETLHVRPKEARKGRFWVEAIEFDILKEVSCDELVFWNDPELP